MGETNDIVRATWSADRTTYIRDHLIMAVVGAVGCTMVLYVVGNPDYWVGAIAAGLAIAVRGGYLASEELAQVWTLTDDAVRSSNGKVLSLSSIDKLRGVGSAVQLITTTGEKHLMKYLADPSAVRREIATAAGVDGP